MEMDNLMERMTMVKAMEFICRNLNNEYHIEQWLYNGVADEDIPYGQVQITGPINRDPAYYYAEDEDRFAELMMEFLDVMRKAYGRNGGLYCGGVSSKEPERPERPFGVVRWHNADLKHALEEDDIPATQENIETLRTACEEDWHFTDRIIDAGWDVIHAKIRDVASSGDFDLVGEED